MSGIIKRIIAENSANRHFGAEMAIYNGEPSLSRNHRIGGKICHLSSHVNLGYRLGAPARALGRYGLQVERHLAAARSLALKELFKVVRGRCRG